MNNLNVLQVESTNFCNAHCVFCPHSKFTEFGTMTDNLYVKVARKVKGDDNEIYTITY